MSIRRVLLTTLVCLLSLAALAQVPPDGQPVTPPPGAGGGGTPITFTCPTTGGPAGSYTCATPTPSTGWALTDGFIVQTYFNADSVGASSLSVAGTTAKPIKLQTIAGLIDTGSKSLLAGSFIYTMTYNLTADAFIVNGSPVCTLSVVSGTSSPISLTPAMWAAGCWINVMASGKEFDLVSSGTTPLGASGGLLFNMGSNTAVLKAGAGDQINYNCVLTGTGGSVTLNAGSSIGVATDGQVSPETFTVGGLPCSMARLDVAGQIVTGGASITALALTPGNVSVDCTARSHQTIANNGAFTLTAPAADSDCELDVNNGASAGAVTFSGFSGTLGGDALDTTNGHKFRLFINRNNGITSVSSKALQ